MRSRADSLALGLLACVAATALACPAQAACPDQRVVRDNPPGLFTSPRFTNVVELPAGMRLVLVSGLTAQGPDGKAPEGAEAQAQAVFANLRVALAARGLTPRDVVQLRGFLVDLPSTLPAYRKAAAAFFGDAAPPASTLVGVSGLVAPNLLIEVELVAAKP